MARTNINILGISELRWIRMGEFNSDDHYIYYCRQESLRMSSPHTQKESKMQYLVTISTMTKWSLFISKANHLTQVYAHITNTKESEVEWFYENLQGILGEGNGTPLQCSCLQNPRDGGAWWAAVYGVAQSQTRPKRLSSSSSSSHLCLHGIFLTQELNLCLWHLLPWKVDSLPPCHQGSPCMLTMRL